MTPEQLDLAVWPIFAAMTARGIRVDINKLEALRVEVERELETQEALLEGYAGRSLDPYSSADVAKWLGAEGLVTGKRTRGGAVSTDERSLSKLTEIHPVPGCVLECRGLAKLLSTFIEPTLEKALAHKDSLTMAGFVHPRWRLTKVKSGRVACEDPNLLAFPARDALGLKVRDCFVARPGHMLFSVDFSQIEPRVAAALSQDEALLKVFAEGRDLYADMARRLFRLTSSDAEIKGPAMSKMYRQPAKIIFLGCLLYGMQAAHLYDELIKFGCGTPSAPFYDMAACEDFVRRRFEPYPGLKALADNTVLSGVKASGWVHTAGGRGRYIPALFVQGSRWPADKLREEGERQAFNHLIQGTAQEIMKAAMVRMACDPKVAPVIHPLLQIHDEMIYEAHAVFAEKFAHYTAAIMESELNHVRIVAGIKVAPSWGGLKG